MMKNKEKSKDELMKIFAENLNHYMKVGGKTREDLVQAFNLPYMTISDWARGLKYPRMDKIEKLAIYFGIKKSDLIEEKDHSNPEPKDEVWEIRAVLQQRPEIRTLFDMSRNAKKEDVEKTIQILKVMQGSNE